MFYTNHITSLTDYDVYENFAWRPIRSTSGKLIFWKKYYKVVNWPEYQDPGRLTLTNNEYLLWQLEQSSTTWDEHRTAQQRAAFFSRNHRLIKGLQRLSEK